MSKNFSYLYRCSICNADDVDNTFANSPELLSANTLNAWMRNGLLHVTGLTIGEVWNVYSVSGALVYRTVATGAEADIPLNVSGVYIVIAGDNTVRVVNSQ